MASATSYILPTDLTITSANGIPSILTRLTAFEQNGKVLQIVYNLNSTTAPTTLSATSFNVPSYIRYTNDIEYSAFTHPISLTNAFALKIFAYITIDNAGLYTFTTAANDKIKLFLNNFLVLDNIIQTSSTVDLVLKAGTYLLYIEKIAPVNDAVLNLKLTPKAVSTPISINTYIKSNFRLLENAKLSRDSAITTYCTPDTNLFSAETTNICNKSLNETDLLNTTLLSSCFPGDIISKDTTTKKIKSGCKTTYDRGLSAPSTLNSKIKTNFDSKWDQWANNTANINNNVNNNVDALEEYLNIRKPNEITFGFSTNIKNYCEDPKNVPEYNVLNTSNKLCKSFYNRSFPSYSRTNLTEFNNSIQQIKNNYCDPNQTIANVSSTDCNTEYTAKSNLANAWNQYCFSNNNNLKKGTNGLYDPTCKTVHNKPDLNTEIKNKLDTSYQTWATNKINGDSNTISSNATALNEYIKDRKPTKTNLFGNNTNAQIPLISYCEAKIGDNFSASSTADTLCDLLYSSSTYNTDPNILNSINTISTKYCIKPGSGGKPRYENDPKCKNEYSRLLLNTIENRCIQNGEFQYSDPWCVTTSNSNINSTSAPFTTMRTVRTNALQNEASKIEVKDYPDKKFLNNNNYQYATNAYNLISDSANKKLSDELLTTQLFQYCENKEPNYPTDPTSQCKGIYDTYKTNSAVSTSRNKMRDELCKLNENITTDNNDTNDNNIFKCKTTVFDTTNNLDKFAPTVNEYCNTGTNIATSNECKDYYTNIENKILDALNLKINAAPVSTFSNKYYHTNSDMVEDYDKKLELSTFQNGSNEQPVDDAPIDSSGEETIPAIYYINAPQSCKQAEENIEYHDSSWLSLLLFFIFILLIVGLFSSCMYYKKKTVNKEETK